MLEAAEERRQRDLAEADARRVSDLEEAAKDKGAALAAVAAVSLVCGRFAARSFFLKYKIGVRCFA